MQAQIPANISGEYHLRGVMETASGFKLNPDSTFEFYFSYGALDREGSGSWKIDGQYIIFNSKPWQGHDFVLTKSSRKPGGTVAIKMDETNPMILNYVHAGVNNSDPQTMQATDGEGFARFRAQQADSISLIFEFCPERTTIIHPQHKGDNYFEFKLEKSITEYFFVDYRLLIGEAMLSGNHPMLQPGSYKFEKRR